MWNMKSTRKILLPRVLQFYFVRYKHLLALATFLICFKFDIFSIWCRKWSSCRIAQVIFLFTATCISRMKFPRLLFSRTAAPAVTTKQAQLKFNRIHSRTIFKISFFFLSFSFSCLPIHIDGFITLAFILYIACCLLHSQIFFLDLKIPDSKESNYLVSIETVAHFTLIPSAATTFIK